MNKLCQDNVEITDPHVLLELQAKFYKNLYTDKVEKCTEEMIEYLDQVKVPTLNETERTKCEGSLTLEECFKALKAMQINKTPGNDGLTVEFYRKFWGLVGPLMVEAPT